VLVVAAAPATRAGLVALLELDDRLEPLGAVADLRQPEARRLASQAEVLVIDPADLGTPRMAGLPTRAALVCLGQPSELSGLLGGLAPAGLALLPRSASSAELGAAVQAAARGLVVLDPAAAAELIQWPRSGRSSDPIGQPLTPRELEVLQLVALGLPNKTIAARLAISEHTAKFHVAQVLGKLGASSRTEAVSLGAQRGLVRL
jgi:DNA-binding NarL/FixJ family response regulator